MSARVTATPPARIDDIGDDWSIQLDAMPHSPLITNGSTGEIAFSSPAKYDSNLAMNNSSSITYTSPAEDTPIGTKVGSTNYSLPAKTAISSTISGMIDSVSISGHKASYTQGTPFSQFATTDVDIPWVSSGSILGAFDLAWQLAGNDRCTLTYPNGRYWSLRGHETGFDYQNKIFFPADYTTYKLNPSNDNTYYRHWDLRDAYSCSIWASAGQAGTGDGDDIFAFRGTGSSPSVTPGTRTSIAFSFNNNTINSIYFGYGTNPGGYSDQQNGNSQRWGFGPFVGSFSAGMGKTLVFTISPTNKNCTTYFTYMDPVSATQVTMTPTIDLSALDWNNSTLTKVVTDTAYLGNGKFRWSLWFRDKSGNTVSWSSGDVNTGQDVYAKPWNNNGPICGLYQITSPISFDPTVLLPNYEVPKAVDSNLQGATLNGGLPPTASLTNPSAYAPILPYTGSLWDYLCQVCTAKEMDLRLRNGRFYISPQGDSQASPKTWFPIVDPTISFDNSNVADTVEIDAQIVRLMPQPIVYDGYADGNQVYSFNAGQTTTFSIDSAFIGSVVLNPEPVYAYSDFKAYTPLGGYIVSGADDLPIVAQQWISGGGSVLVKQTGVRTLEVTINSPNIITANGDQDQNSGKVATYYLGVSDGQNQYSVFTLAGGAGDVAKPVKRTFQTGAAYALGNSSPGTISNPCASNNTMINTLASSAAVIASGPNMKLSGQAPVTSVQNWGISDLGMLPGTVIYYANLAWRILSYTLSENKIDFTAMPLSTYQLPAWATNWSGKSMDQYIAQWSGKSHDDMKTMLLSGIAYDYMDNGQRIKFTVYPAAGFYPGKQTFPGGNINAY